mgnify:CR=1 FL=1
MKLLFPSTILILEKWGIKWNGMEGNSNAEPLNTLELPDYMVAVQVAQLSLNCSLLHEVVKHRLPWGISNNFPLFVKLGQQRLIDDARQRPEPRLEMPGFHFFGLFYTNHSHF